MDKRTFSERMNDLPRLDKRREVRRIYALTEKNESTIYRWIAKENPTRPDALTQKVIAQDYGVPLLVLFPFRD